MPESARSFADDVRARDDAQLSMLLCRRPDLARPAPADLNALAARAATLPSTRRALEHLDAGLLHVLEAVLVAGESGPEAAALLDVPPQELAEPLQELWTRALLWRSPSGLRAARAVGEALTHPAGLGPSAAELGLRLPADLSSAIGAVGENGSLILDRLRWNGSRITGDGPKLNSAIDALVAAHLLARSDEGAILPREVALALRGGRLYEQSLATPRAELKVLPLAHVDAAAGAEALMLCEQVEEVATAWSQDPPRVLRSGGLAVKDLKSIASRLDLSEQRAAFVVEIATAAGLFASDGEAQPSWLPTSAYDDWRASSPAHRAAALATTWWSTTRAPSLVGTSPDRHGAVNALSDRAAWPLLRTRRQDVFDVLATAEPGSVFTTEAVDELLRWRRPLRLAPGAQTHSATVLTEAGWVGALGRSALSSLGRALQSGNQTPVVDEVAAAILPEPVDHVLIQADLTAIAPGPLTDDVGRLMRTAAVIESRGGATVFRFTETSIRAALESGISAGDLLEQLREASRTPIPQPLQYLVEDVARRHGRTRIGSVGCYVRSDDETALATLLADSSLAPLQLRRIAPTVLVSPAPAARALDLLRPHAAVAETSDGGVVLATREGPRSRLRPARPEPVRVERIDEDAAATLVADLRRRTEESARERRDRPGPDIPETEVTVTVTTLADAAAQHAPVWIGYVDETGAARRALFHPERIAGGRAVGTVDGTLGRRTFTVHRITGVAPVE
ncbi:helicase-associated domain-containing protein [Dermacoccaceae bacterium W4C1]